MGNKATLQPNVFSTENQPAKHSSRKGIPNRATVFKKWLTTKIQIDDPKAKDKKVTVTLLEAAALGQIESAMKGNTNAWKEIQDTLHGKQTEKIEQDVNQKVIVEFVKHDSDGTSDTDKG